MSDLSVSWPGYQSGNGAETKAPAVKVAVPEACEMFPAFGNEMTVLLSGADTGGKLAMCIDVTPPGGGPPPHYHLNEDEWFFPLEGEVEFLLNGEWQAVAVGTAVFVPRGTVHTFRNVGSGYLKVLVQTTPSGFEIFFERCAAEFAKPGPPDMARITDIAAEHGIHFVTD